MKAVRNRMVKVLQAITIGAGLIVGFTQGAYAQRVPIADRPHAPVDGREGGRFRDRVEYKEVILNQTFRGENTLALRQLLGLGPNYRGMAVKRVWLIAMTQAGRGQAQLVVNGQSEGRAQTVGIRMADYAFDLGRMNVIGDDIQTLQIQLNGNFTVDRVGVEIEEDRFGRQDEVTQDLRIRSTGRNIVDLLREMRLGREHFGKNIKAIIVEAKTDMGRGTMAVAVNGRLASHDQVVARMWQNYTFMLPGFNELGRDVRTLDLELNGNFDIGRVTIQFERAGGGRPPFPPRR